MRRNVLPPPLAVAEISLLTQGSMVDMAEVERVVVPVAGVRAVLLDAPSVVSSILKVNKGTSHMEPV